MMFAYFPKKRHLGPKNSYGSFGHEKLPKIVKCAKITETDRNNGTIVGVQV